MLLKTHSFEFGEFLLDAKEKVLLRQGKPLPITPKIFQLLLVLIEKHGHLVEKSVLMNTVWADSFVEESNLTFTIRQLRKILGDDTQNPRFIETVPKRGYRFIADVKEVSANDVFAQEKLLIKTDAEHTSFVNGWHPRPVLYSIFGFLMIIFLLTAGFFVWRGNRQNEFPARSDVSENLGLRFETVTSSSKPIAAAISPDGKYVVYVNIANGQQSLWLRQLSSGINTPIVASESGVIFGGIEFSSNGEYVYFTRRYKDEPTHLDRVSILGGTVKIGILSDLDGAFSISPDDRQISFRRYEEQKHTLLLANIDGSDARPIFETSKTFTDNVFSPDGKTIAFASGQSDTGDQDFGVYTINVESGEVKPATDFKWHHVKGVLWLPDQSGLLITARTKNDEPQQFWKISLPNGEVKKITDTQNDFSAISATKDLSQILLTQISLSSNLYLASSAAPDNVQPIVPASGGIVWTPEGNLVFCSSASGNRDIWLLNSDRMNQKQLTTEDSADFNPQISPDANYIVFVSDRAGKNNLWRMNADGGNPVQLTDGEGEQTPVFTTDGAFVVFNSMKDVSLWKVSIEGGKPLQISEKRAYNISISPDGTKFAYFAQNGDKSKVVVESFQNGNVAQEFAIPEGYFGGRDIVWTKDGNALIYAAEDANSVGNLWQQSLNGAPPHKLTNYVSDEIFYFNFSSEGSQLALIRGSWNHDVVLVKGFK